MNIDFVYGTTRVKPHKFGNWLIKEFEVTENEADFFNMRMRFQGKEDQCIRAGKYLRLEQISTGYVVMSNTPMECDSNKIAYEMAHGSVLMAGLGMGMILEAILSKPEVTHVRIIEIEKDIIDYVGSFFKDDPRVEIIHGNILDYQPAKDEFYNYVWLDIWDDINENNEEDFQMLNDRFSDHCKAMNLWSMDLLGFDPEDYCKIAI